MKRLITLILLILSAVLVACGGSAELLTTEDIDEEALLETLLTLEDMPTGWAVEQAAAFEERTPGGTYTIYCATRPTRSIAAANVTFNNGAFGPFLGQSVTVYPDSQNAKDALDDVTSAVEECPEMTDDEGNVSTNSLLSFPSLGEQTLAHRTVQGLGQIDGVRILVNNVIITVNHSGLGSVHIEQTEAFIRAAVEKYERSR